MICYWMVVWCITSLYFSYLFPNLRSNAIHKREEYLQRLLQSDDVKSVESIGHSCTWKENSISSITIALWHSQHCTHRNQDLEGAVHDLNVPILQRTAYHGDIGMAIQTCDARHWSFLPYTTRTVFTPPRLVPGDVKCQELTVLKNCKDISIYSESIWHAVLKSMETKFFDIPTLKKCYHRSKYIGLIFIIKKYPDKKNRSHAMGVLFWALEATQRRKWTSYPQSEFQNSTDLSVVLAFKPPNKFPYQFPTVQFPSTLLTYGISASPVDLMHCQPQVRLPSWAGLTVMIAASDKHFPRNSLSTQQALLCTYLC